MSEVLNTEQTSRSLWIGDLPSWVEESYLFNLFAGSNHLLSVKLIRNRSTGLSEGYGFLRIPEHMNLQPPYYRPTMATQYQGRTSCSASTGQRTAWARPSPQAKVGTIAS